MPLRNPDPGQRGNGRCRLADDLGVHCSPGSDDHLAQRLDFLFVQEMAAVVLDLFDDAILDGGIGDNGLL